MNSESTTATSADQLEALIHRHLLGRVRVRELRVVLQDGGLVLQGRVPTYYAKQLAQHAAMEATGLRILANQIEVC